MNISYFLWLQSHNWMQSNDPHLGIQLMIQQKMVRASNDEPLKKRHALNQAIIQLVQLPHTAFFLVHIST